VSDRLRDTRITVRLPSEELRTDLIAAAERRGISVGALVVQAIERDVYGSDPEDDAAPPRSAPSPRGRG
jgi:hypothetical protein